MKPFDLSAALGGEPVRLRDGRKAVVLIDYRDTGRKYGINYEGEYPIRGFIVNDYGKFLSWTAQGFYDDDGTYHNDDIVGMWEEPVPTITIGDMEVPAPLTEEPKLGERFWAIDLTRSIGGLHSIDTETWWGVEYDNQRFNAGMVFKTKEDAEKAHAAWRVLMTKQFEKVKEQQNETV